MAGIYIHIPFCSKACVYCDFHFSTSLKTKDLMIQSMLKELDLQKDYLQNQDVSTIYFGGGTPSLLSAGELDLFLNKIAKDYPISDLPEVTLEANPDSLDAIYLTELKSLGINRLSIGIQSFYDHHLQWMNRTHSAEHSMNCVHIAQTCGFEDISIDLIFGFPQLSEEEWERNLKLAIELNVPHISSYSMAVAPFTAMAHQIKQKKMRPIDEEQSASHFLKGKETLIEAGYDHYEISSFSKIGHSSKHNSNYWKGVPYLGIGPSAHSFNGSERHWNIRNNVQYIQFIEQNIIPCEKEKLTIENQLNEQILTQLRMKEGLNLTELQEKYGAEFISFILKDAQPHLDAHKLLLQTNNYLTLTTEGQLYADIIAADLFQ